MASSLNYLCILIWLEVVLVCHGLIIKDSKSSTLNNRPIIGVMAQATHGNVYPKFGRSYIAASYIKYLESSGARVVPIMNDLSEDETDRLFSSINGVLFPGGEANLNTSGYAKIGRRIIDLAMNAFDRGDYFPIWGSCLGFEFLSVQISGNLNILSKTDSENLPLPLNLSQDYNTSKMFGKLPQSLAYFMSTAPTTMNNHGYSVLTSTFEANLALKKFFNILSTSKDRNGVEFVSTMEGIKYPIFATQWHPEKNTFEWSLNENIPHQEMSIKVTQFMSNFFVNQARLNQHKFATQEEEDAALIYNYDPVYTGNVSNFEQCYFFKSPQGIKFPK